MGVAYNQIRLRLQEKRARQGMRLAEIAERADDEKRRQGKTLKVFAFPQGEGEYVPAIRVAGKWLERFGFKLGDEVILVATQEQILITKKEVKDGRRKSRYH